MLVSAIIPVRNMAQTLGRAIASVQAQTYPVFEIVVADDLSNDGSASVAADYGLGVLRNPGAEPWGICGGRNAAFECSKGDLILPLDADDWIEPTYVEKTIQKMTDRVAIVSTEMIYHSEDERNGLVLPADPQTYASELKQNNITVTSLVRRKAIEQAGPWDHDLRGWEDWDMWLRILLLGWTHDVVREPLFHYRLNNSGMNAWADENKKRLIYYLRKKHMGFVV